MDKNKGIARNNLIICDAEQTTNNLLLELVENLNLLGPPTHDTNWWKRVTKWIFVYLLAFAIGWFTCGMIGNYKLEKNLHPTKLAIMAQEEENGVSKHLLI